MVSRCLFFLFNDTPTTEIYTLSLHDALPISSWAARSSWVATPTKRARLSRTPANLRSEEHTSELQSLRHLVCRLLLEKKKAKPNSYTLVQLIVDGPRAGGCRYTHSLSPNRPV